MLLVRIEVLLARVKITKPTYYNLLNRGVLPHYAEKVTTPGKRGFHYLYDEDAFMKAWEVYRESRKRGVGINRVGKEESLSVAMEYARGLTAEDCVKRILDPMRGEPGETPEQFHDRFMKERERLLQRPFEELQRGAAEWKLKRMKPTFQRRA